MHAVRACAAPLTRRRAQKWSTFKCEYEILLDRNSQVEHVPGDPMENMRPVYKFKKIGELQQTAQRELVDVLGVVHSVNSAATIVRKDGSGTEKRSVYIRDDSGHTIEVTMWTPFASREGSNLEQVRGAPRALACAATLPVAAHAPHAPSADAPSRRAPHGGMQGGARLRLWWQVAGHGRLLRL